MPAAFSIKVHDKLLLKFFRNDPRFSHIFFTYQSLESSMFSFLKQSFMTFIDGVRLLKFITFKQSTGEFKIATDICDGLDDKNGRSEVNWIRHLKTTDQQDIALFLMDAENNDLTSEESHFLHQFKKNGGTIVTELPKLARELDAIYFKIPRERKLKIPLLASNFTARIFSWITIYYFWLLLFKKLKINTWLMIAEFPIDNLIQRFAMEKLNGVMLTRQRSELGAILGHQYQPGHIGLFWTADGLKLFQSIGNDIELGLSIGHAFIDLVLLNHYQTVAKKIRDDFKKLSNDSIMVISLFDNMHGENFEVTTVELEKILSNIIAKIKSNPNLFLIIKSKKTYTLLPHLSESDKAFCLSSKQIKFFAGNYLPSIICLASDLCIGIGASSPVWEGNILGKAGVHYWPAPDSAHVLKKEINKQILLTSIEALEKILCYTSSQLKEFKTGLTNSESSKSFDEWSDGRGPERTALILKICRTFKYDKRSELYREIENQLQYFNKNSDHKFLKEFIEFSAI